MIYCVVPEQFGPELYDRLATYYRDDPNVEVIVDRRRSERRSAEPENGTHRRELRDRRRHRVPGEFPPLEAGGD